MNDSCFSSSQQRYRKSSLPKVLWKQSDVCCRRCLFKSCSSDSGSCVTNFHPSNAVRWSVTAVSAEGLFSRLFSNPFLIVLISGRICTSPPQCSTTDLSRLCVVIPLCSPIILPVVLYGCEAWSLTLREERRLRVFENRVLRRVFGPKRDEVTGEWRKLHNEELSDLYSLPNREE